MNDSLKSVSRRRFMQESLLIIPAVGLGSAPLTASAAEESPALEDYQPIFFKPDEWRFVLAACDRLIPSDGAGPGALEVNVPVFIDKQMEGDFGRAADWYMQPPFVTDAPPELGYQSPLTPSEVYRKGIAATAEYCRQEYGKTFAELDEAQRDGVLTRLEKGELSFDDVSASQFFSFLLQNTKEGYFADPIHGGNKHMLAWQFIGFPGARASYLEWVGQHNVPYPLGPVSITGERA